MSLFAGPETVMGGGRDMAALERSRSVAPARFGGKPWWRPDATALLSAYLVLLLLIPARLVVPSVGGAGRPALLLGLGLLGVWAVSRVVPYLTTRGPNPVRRALMIYVLVYALTYALGYARQLPVAERLSADRSLFATASLLGVALLAADGIRSRERLDTLLGRLVSLGSVVAVFGILQFMFGIDIAGMIKIPGLVLNAEIIGIGERGAPGFRRVAGTAGHPIEFGVVMGMLLPLAVHRALHPRTRTEGWLRGAQIGALVLGVAFSISRSGAIALMVGLLVLGISWAPELKAKALVVAVAAMVLLRGAVPGLLGTFRSLFLNIGSDPSIQGRQDDYPYAFSLVEQRPWFGRGPGTYLPEQYVVLDNQVLGTLVSTGYVGLCAFFLLYLMGTSVARRVARRGATDESRHLAQAMMATVTAALVVTFTFDAFAYALYTGILFLTLGCAGALWRLERTGDSGAGRERARSTPVLKGWRRVGNPEPHPLGRVFPDLAASHGWRRSRPV
ncbi:MAG: O-antigen ligase family protein [Acidimicrobiia bacterium]